MRRVIFVWIFAAVAIAVAAAVGRARLNRASSAEASDMKTEETTKADPAGRIFAGGIVEGVHRELSLRFEVSGRIGVVHVREGDTVAAGDVLAELETDVSMLRVAEARTRLKIAVAERDRLVAESMQVTSNVARGKLPAAEKQTRDAESLLEEGQSQARQGTVSGRELDRMRQKRDRATVQLQSLREQVDSPESRLSREEETIVEGNVKLAETALKRERLLLDKTRLCAPAAGLVLRAAPEPGELTGPGDDRELFTIVDPSAVRVRAFVEEFDAMRVAAGQRAVISVCGRPDQKYQGTVSTCPPYVGPKSHRHFKPGERVDVRVREVLIDLDDRSDLLVGLPVEVLIEY